MRVIEDIEPIATTVDGAARALGLAPRTVRKRIADGKLAALKDGARVVVPVDALRSYIAALEAA